MWVWSSKQSWGQKFHLKNKNKSEQKQDETCKHSAGKSSEIQ